MSDKNSSSPDPALDQPLFREAGTWHQGIECLNCHVLLTRSEPLNNDSSPTPGAIGLCWDCGHVQVFDDPPTRYRELTGGEVVELAGWAVVVIAGDLRATWNKREALLKSGELTPFMDVQLGRQAIALVRKLKAAVDADAKGE